MTSGERTIYVNTCVYMTEKLEKVPVPQFIWAVNEVTEEFRKKGQRIGWTPKPNDYYVCDPLEGDFTDFSLEIPTIVGTVIAEFGMITDYGVREELSREDREKYVKEYYGEEGGEKILAEYRKQYPGKNEIYAADLDGMFLPATVDYVKKKAAEAKAPSLWFLTT